MFRELKARPLIFLLIGLILGINFPSWFPVWALFSVFAALVRSMPLLWSALGLLFGVYVSYLHPPPDKVAAGSFAGTIRISSFPEYARAKTVCSATSSRGSLIAKFSGQQSFGPGDLIQVSGVVNAGKESNLQVKTWTTETKGYLSWISALRIGAIRRLQELYGEEDASWVNALTFNYPTELSSENKQALRNSGTFHLVSASGMHIWIVAVVINYLLIQLRLLRTWQIPLIGVALVLYCCLTGFHAPTVRAAIMWLCFSSAYLFKRSPDGLSALMASAIIWLCFEPNDAFTASFQLSYIVTGALVMWFERRHTQGTSEIQSGLESSLVASFAAEPLAMWWFGRLVVIGPIANGLVGLASSCILVFGLISLLPIVGIPFVFVTKPLVWGVRTLTEFTALAPVVQVPMRFLNPWILGLYFSVLVLIILGRRPKIGDPFKRG